MSFSLIFAVILLFGWGGGRLMKYLGLPPVLGMILGGVLISLLFGAKVPSSLWGVESFLKSLALIVILLRAGLGINRKMLLQNSKTVILMSFLPCLIEAATLCYALMHIFSFSFTVAGLTAFMLAAVSPAIIVPSMLDLREKGYGARKQVPTIILAGASVDNVLAITLFYLFIEHFKSGLGYGFKDLAHIPFAIGLGIGIGLIAGLVLVWFFRKLKVIRATEKVIILLGLCLVLLELGDMIHIAALLGAMTVGYVLFEKENQIAHEMAAKLNKIWVLAEIILFVLIGMSLNPSLLRQVGWKGLLVIFIGLGFKTLGVILATAFSPLNKREKAFCIMAYLPKATVQAALGSIPLSLGMPEGATILALAVLAILVTGPLGMLLVNKYGARLLQQ